MCIALVLRTVVSNKYGELLIFHAPLASFFNFPVSAVSSIFFWWRDFGTSTLTHGSIASTASLFPEKKWLSLQAPSLDANLGTKDSQPTPFGGGPPWLR